MHSATENEPNEPDQWCKVGRSVKKRLLYVLREKLLIFKVKMNDNEKNLNNNNAEAARAHNNTKFMC